MAFQQLKRYLEAPLLFSSSKREEVLCLYLTISRTTVSSALMISEEGTQLPVYYTSRTLHYAELNYPRLEKLTYTFLITSRKLRPYFQAQAIDVLTDRLYKGQYGLWSWGSLSYPINLRGLLKDRLWQTSLLNIPMTRNWCWTSLSFYHLVILANRALHNCHT